MDEIDKILMDAVYDSCHAGFQPCIDHIMAALPVLCQMRALLEDNGLINEKQSFSVASAIGVVVMHLEHAYPEFAARLKAGA